MAVVGKNYAVLERGLAAHKQLPDVDGVGVRSRPAAAAKPAPRAAPVALEVRNRIAQTTDYFLAHGVSDPAAAHQQAIIALGKAVKHQALVMGFSDTFAVIAVVLVLAALAVLLTRKAKGVAGGAH